MGKVWIEVSLISARGLRRFSLWKLQWFAVGWIDPKNKYCTRIDETGNPNPIWKTKFATLIDGSAGSGLSGLALHVEVYSREPVFLRESLLGTASVPLKEFISKHSRKGDRKGKAAIEEVGSYQLRKGDSGKTLGFIDVSVHISEEGDRVRSDHYSDQGGMVLMDHENNQITSEKDDGSAQPQLHITRRARQNQRPGELPLGHNHNIPNYPGQPAYQPPRGAGYPSARTIQSQEETGDHPTGTMRSQVETGYHPARTMHPHVETGYHPARTMQPHVETGYNPTRTMHDPQVKTGYHPARTMHQAGRPEYPTARTPPPPPPPSHVGFIPTVMPRMENVRGSYMNVPPSTSRGPGFGAGLGAGALAAGAVIFGDDFLSGFDYVRDGSSDPSLSVSVDHPF